VNEREILTNSYVFVFARVCLCESYMWMNGYQGSVTYLTADYHGLECPWGGENLELSRFETWSSLAWIALGFMFVYPIGTPLVMWLVMR
jgi:hypothetical protein